VHEEDVVRLADGGDLERAPDRTGKPSILVETHHPPRAQHA
jgi:hypothetical protein